MKIKAKDLTIGMMFIADDRPYRVVDVIKGCVTVQIDCRRQTELGEILSNFCVPSFYEFDLPEAP